MLRSQSIGRAAVAPIMRTGLRVSTSECRRAGYSLRALGGAQVPV